MISPSSDGPGAADRRPTAPQATGEFVAASRASAASIRAVERALQLLELISHGEPLTATQMSARSGLPRTTVVRLMATMTHAGFAIPAAGSTGYAPGPALHRIAGQMRASSNVVDAAREVADRLCAECGWPVSVMTIANDEAVVRYTTDEQSRAGVIHCTVGYRLPLLASASGRLHLALCSEEERRARLERLARSADTPCDPVQLERELETVRTQGFAKVQRPARLGTRRAIAAPLYGPDGKLAAALVVRFPEAALRGRDEQQTFVAPLLAAARQCSAPPAGTGAAA